MYDELVMRLREAPNDWYDADLHYEAADAIEEMQRCIDGIDADNDSLCQQIEELQGQLYLMKKTAEWLSEKVPKWIPVAERLPEENGDYIVYCIGGNYNQTSCISLAYWGGDHFYVDSFLTVTHWMNLPEPPKGDE